VEGVILGDKLFKITWGEKFGGGEQGCLPQCRNCVNCRSRNILRQKFLFAAMTQVAAGDARLRQ